jgi:hypothetical protein
MEDAERYLQIATKHTPPGVIVVPVEDSEDGHRGMAHEEQYDEEGNELPRRMEAPIPDTLLHLWIYLHECAHLRLWHYSRPDINEYSRNEAEADLEVIRIFDEEYLVASLEVLEDQLETLLPHVLIDDKLGERDSMVIRCLQEFDRRIKAAFVADKK